MQATYKSWLWIEG